MTTSEKAENKIKTIASLVKGLSTICLVFLLLSAAYPVFQVVFDNPLNSDPFLKRLLPKGMEMALVPYGELLASITMFLPGLVGATAMLMLRKLFNGFSAGEIYTFSSAARLRALGWAIFLIAPVNIICKFIAVGFLTSFLNFQMMQLSSVIGWGNIKAITIGLIIVIFGQTLHEAVRHAEENKAMI